MQGETPKRKRRARKTPKDRFPLQIDLTPEDDADLMLLVGELKSRAAVGRVLFLYGLDNSEAAFGAYAKPHQEARRARLVARAALPSETK
jgi:hypothetical protein